MFTIMVTKFFEFISTVSITIKYLLLDIMDITGLLHVNPFNDEVNNHLDWYKFLNLEDLEDELETDDDLESDVSDEDDELLSSDDDDLDLKLDELLSSDDDEDEDEELDSEEEFDLEEYLNGFNLDLEQYNLEEFPTKIRLVSIEGNIGAGKTTLINNLKKKYPNRDDILFLEEPIDVWNTIQDEKGKNILQNFYENLGKYAFTFQVMAYTTRLQLMKKTIANAPRTVKVIVMERSLEADANIFAKMLYEEGVMGRMDYQIYSLMTRDNWDDYGVDGIIWLRTDARECYSRIQGRNREGEEGIDLAYLRKCEQYHLEWLSADLGFVCDIGGEDLETDLEKIEKYLDL